MGGFWGFRFMCFVVGLVVVDFGFGWIVLGVWIWVGLCICGVVDFVDCVLRWVCVCFLLGWCCLLCFVLFV